MGNTWTHPSKGNNRKDKVLGQVTKGHANAFKNLKRRQKERHTEGVKSDQKQDRNELLQNLKNISLSLLKLEVNSAL